MSDIPYEAHIGLESAMPYSMRPSVQDIVTELQMRLNKANEEIKLGGALTIENFHAITTLQGEALALAKMLIWILGG